MAPDEGSPVEIVNSDGSSDVLLICEHASNLVPASLKALGLDQEALSSHIAWDPGAAAVARLMAKTLAAPLILQRLSRLVYDCNRPPEAESAMPIRSEVFEIPGNVGLTDGAREARVEAVYRPFRDAVARQLDRMITEGRAPAVVTIHSFTPVFHGRRRSVEIGLLHDIDTTLADAMLGLSADWRDLDVRRNQPYGPEDGVTHTLQVDAIARGLANVMIEIRNDLIATPDQQSVMAARLSGLLSDGLRRLPPVERPRAYGAGR
ncbi:MAG: N-formylglutamate amidohydrolase [Alphaproteobacteria bacterium]|nr:N-formylglutamate amidohydrolase [Alphaproteobacteria bacterium]